MDKTSSSVSYPPAENEEQRPRGAPGGLRVACVILAIATGVSGFEFYQASSALAGARQHVAQATFQIAQTKADLTQANAQSEAQLKKSDARINDLQTQLTAAQGQNSDLQAQLQKARSQGADLQTQLNSAKTQTGLLQAQLSEANAGTADLHKALDAAKGQTADLQAQLAQSQAQIAKLQPLAVKAETMPVATDFKKSFWSNGFTLEVTNRRADPLKVNIAVGGTGSMPAKSATIAGGSTYDVDGLAAGATVVLTSAGFDPVNLTVR